MKRELETGMFHLHESEAPKGQILVHLSGPMSNIFQSNDQQKIDVLTRLVGELLHVRVNAA